MTDFRRLRIAIVHYWFVARRGGERVVEVLAKMFPEADIYALLADPGALPESFAGRSVKTSFIQKIPGSLHWHRQLIPLYPYALEQFDLRGYDLVISSESGPAKGVLTDASTCHVCYCHSPMRYLWDFYPAYLERKLKPSSMAFSLAAHYLRMWDLATASRVDYFVANSENVAGRIRKHYRRKAEVVYPPVEVSLGRASEGHDGYYLFVGELVKYKRADLAIEACSRLSRPLRVVGDGPEYKRLRRLCGAGVQWMGRLSGDDLRQQYARCRALIFPGEEDFGIVPVEAQSCGRPVIAYGRGGVLESVSGYIGKSTPVERTSGIFFREQTVESLKDAIVAFEAVESGFSAVFIRSQVERFDVSHFRSKMDAFIRDSLKAFSEARNSAKEYEFS